MKTDRFSDIIRRKLESIRPEFSEKDWTRMQASLQSGMPQPASPPASQPFSGGMWAAKPWLLAAATVSTVVMVAYSFWQQREINQLRQTLSQLRKPAIHQPASTNSDADKPANTPSGETQQQASSRLPSSTAARDNSRSIQQPQDTVYITRYVGVPSKSHVVPPNEEGHTNHLETTPEQRDQRYAATNRVQKSTAQPNQSDSLTNNPNTDAYGEPSTSSLSNTNSTNSSVTVTKATARTTRGRKQKGEYTDTRQVGVNREPVPGSTYRKGDRVNNSVAGTTPNKPNYTTAPAESTPVDLTKAPNSATIESISSLPLSTKSANWTGMLAQRAKRMRPARTTVVGGAEPASAPESQRVAGAGVHLRVGLGGELASKVMSGGLFTEVLLGKHWTVSAGLSQASYTGDRFVNDFDFDIRMRRDFRKEFAHTIDPRRDIFNIDTRTTRLLIPVALGYRIPISHSLTFSPTIGTALNLTSTENATFYCPVLIPQRGFEELSYSDKRTIPLFTTFTLGTGVEWQRGHWVVQGSPVLTIPTQTVQSLSQPDQNWQTSTTVGLRARLLYQF